jgi:hypothetical protein
MGDSKYSFLFSGRSKNAGKNGIEEAVCLQKAVDATSAQVTCLEKICSNVNLELYEVSDTGNQLPALCNRLENYKSSL